MKLPWEILPPGGASCLRVSSAPGGKLPSGQDKLVYRTQHAIPFFFKKSPVFVSDNHFFASDIAKHDSTAFY